MNTYSGTGRQSQKELRINRLDLLAVVAVCVIVGAAIGVSITKMRLTSDAAITAAFHRRYHDSWHSRTLENTRWFGVRVLKNPLDMWIYQEIINETRPDVLIETGTYRGGSAYYFASLFDLLNHGRVITIDIEDHPDKPKHPRISYLLGSSTSDEILKQVRALISPGEKVMVTLDSDHRKKHVLNELRLYAPLVTPGSYLVVEDTHLSGHPLLTRTIDQFGNDVTSEVDPWGATAQFLRTNADFAADQSREKFGFTFNPHGWLKRVR